MVFTSTILCVDDDEDDLFFIKEVIESQGHSFDIEQAHNGWEALNFLQQAVEQSRFPCLIIMDMNMPRMDGKNTIINIRQHEQLSRIPIVVFTTSSNEDHKEYFETQGIRFVTKPFDYKIFTQEIISLLAFCADIRQ